MRKGDTSTNNSRRKMFTPNKSNNIKDKQIKQNNDKSQIRAKLSLSKQNKKSKNQSVAKKRYPQTEKKISEPKPLYRDDKMIIKLILVGDGNVGKTSMIISYTTNEFPNNYVPTILDNFQATVKCSGKTVILDLYDTPGQQQYSRIRPLTYENTDVFMLCFSLVDNNSFDNLFDKWLPEINQNCPNSQKIFVATKADERREIDMMRQYGYNKGQQLYKIDYISKKIRRLGYKFYQCSAMKQDGLNEAFTQAINTIIRKRQQVQDEEETWCTLI